MTLHRHTASLCAAVGVTVCLAVAAPAFAASPGTIDTVAGSPGYGTALGVSLAPYAMAVHSGHLYISDDQWGVVRDLDLSSGQLSVAAGNSTRGSFGDGGPATQAQLDGPEGVAVDSGGDIFVSDSFGHRVRRVDAITRVITTVAGDGTSGYTGDGGPATQAEVNEPAGLAVDSSGDLYIADTGNSTVRRVDALTGAITTVAGTGKSGYSGDGGPGAQAQLWGPLAVAIAPDGGVVIADTFNNRIRRVDPSTGIITTIAGNGTAGFSGDGGDATQAELNTAAGVAVGPDGSVDISDQGNVRIREVSPVPSSDGTHHISTIAGSGTQGFSGDGGPATSADFGSPYGIATGPDGSLYVGDYFNYRVRAITPAPAGRVISSVAGNGQLYDSGDGGNALAAQVFGPSGITVDAGGDLYIIDGGTNTVRRVDAALSADGTHHIETVAGNATAGTPASGGGPATSVVLDFPSGIAVDPAGDMYIAESAANQVARVDAATGLLSIYAGNGQAGALGDGAPATLAELNSPQGIALDPAGDLFIADRCNNEIREVAAGTTLNGAHLISTVAGHTTPVSPPPPVGPRSTCPAGAYAGDGGPAVAASLNDPQGLAVGADGSLYIADGNNNRIRKVDSGGTITTIAGSGTAGYSGDGGPASSAELSFPSDVALDAAGDLFIDDYANQRIREIAHGSGVITPFAGNGSTGDTSPFYSGDGGPALSAGIAQPSEIASDAAGDVFVAAPYAHRLREVFTATSLGAAVPDVSPRLLIALLLAAAVPAGLRRVRPRRSKN